MTQMTVYAWGANSHGQLGLGFESELCMLPQALPKCSFLPTNVICIRGGGGHVLVLDSGGRVHACGWNNRGQLGLDSPQDCHNTFQCVPREFFEDAAVKSIACGWDISGCITVTGKLYVWGSNAFQQIGICQRGFTAMRRPLPLTLPRGETALHISFGLRHCAILTEDYKLYIFGRLRINEPSPSELCVTATTLNNAKVLKIQASAASELRIASVTCGQNHLLLKMCTLAKENNSKRRIIALGDNKFGQANSFQFDTDVQQIAVGWTHNAVLLKNKRVFLWGRNSYGQLGTGSSTDFQAVPIELKLPDSAVPQRLHMGSEHSLLRSSSGFAYTWGWNEHGNCGNESTENLLTPTQVKLPSMCKIAGAGAGFCYAICQGS